MPEVDTIVVIGNGPSARDIDWGLFDNVHTFGMKNAYRFFMKKGWWPTYFGNFDVMSLQKNVGDYQKIVRDPSIPVKMFFMAVPICTSPRLKVLKMRSGLYQFGTTWETFGDGGNTAVNCAQAAVCMGYRKIVLIGVDCVWRHTPRVTGPYTVVDPAANKDYFFDDYKRLGDVCNAPRPNLYHIPAWRRFGEFAADCGVEVVNCSPFSQLGFFRLSSLERELQPAVTPAKDRQK